MTSEQAKLMCDIRNYFVDQRCSVWTVQNFPLNYFLLGYKGANALVCIAPGGMTADQARAFTVWKGSVEAVHTMDDAIRLCEAFKADTKAVSWEGTDERRVDIIGQNGNNGEHYDVR